MGGTRGFVTSQEFLGGGGPPSRCTEGAHATRSNLPADRWTHGASPRRRRPRGCAKEHRLSERMSQWTRVSPAQATGHDASRAARRSKFRPDHGTSPAGSRSRVASLFQPPKTVRIRSVAGVMAGSGLGVRVRCISSKRDGQRRLELVVAPRVMRRVGVHRWPRRPKRVTQSPSSKVPTNRGNRGECGNRAVISSSRRWNPGASCLRSRPTAFTKTSPPGQARRAAAPGENPPFGRSSTRCGDPPPTAAAHRWTGSGTSAQGRCTPAAKGVGRSVTTRRPRRRRGRPGYCASTHAPSRR